MVERLWLSFALVRWNSLYSSAHLISKNCVVFGPAESVPSGSSQVCEVCSRTSNTSGIFGSYSLFFAVGQGFLDDRNPWTLRFTRFLRSDDRLFTKPLSSFLLTWLIQFFHFYFFDELLPVLISPIQHGLLPIFCRGVPFSFFSSRLWLTALSLKLRSNQMLRGKRSPHGKSPIWHTAAYQFKLDCDPLTASPGTC